MEQIKNAWEAPVLEELSLGRDTEFGSDGVNSDAYNPGSANMS